MIRNNFNNRKILQFIFSVFILSTVFSIGWFINTPHASAIYDCWYYEREYIGCQPGQIGDFYIDHYMAVEEPPECPGHDDYYDTCTDPICNPVCNGEMCGQGDTCGGSCPSTDAATPGMCGNPVACSWSCAEAPDHVGGNPSNPVCGVYRQCSQDYDCGSCAVDGGWSGWSGCDASCGIGQQTRTCDNPPPYTAGGDVGANCVGPSTQTCDTGISCITSYVNSINLKKAGSATSSVQPDNTTQYTITIAASSDIGAAYINSEYVYINENGNGGYRGNAVWSNSNWMSGVACSGGGYGGVYIPYQGSSFMTLLSCSTSTVGNTRTTVFTVKFPTSFTTPVNGNMIFGLVDDSTSSGWTYTGTSFNLSLLSNLKAAAPSPTSATAGTALNFTSTISNNGGASTGASFNNFFQVNNATTGTGGITTDLTSTSMAALGISGTGTATSPAYTFTTGWCTSGTCSVRACADKSNSASTGTITEWDENDNCSSPWTNVTVTNTYTATASAGANGTISPASRVVNSGSTTTFTVTPNATYSATMGGTCPAGSLVGTTYTTGAIVANCTVTATFSQNTFTVTPSAGANGTISPSTPQTVNSGSTTTFTVTPSAGYTASVGGTCGGSLVGTTYTTSAISANCTVVASFTINTFTVTPSAGANGTISPSTPQTVNYNTTKVFTVTPSAGYSASMSGTCPAGSLVGTTYTTGAITANCTVIASFTINTYTVTPSAGANGTISPSTPQTANYNTTKVFTVTPNANYSASVGGTCGGSLVGTTYTTNAVTANCTVVASFSLVTYTVTPSAGANGTISPSTPQSIGSGTTTTFTVTPTGGYSASVGGTCGGSLVGTTYTTNTITGNCTVSASFTQNYDYNLTATALPNSDNGGAGNFADNVITVTHTAGTPQSTTVSFQTIPAGITAKVNGAASASCTPPGGGGNCTLNGHFTVATNSPPGSYCIVIVANPAGHTTQFCTTVQNYVDLTAGDPTPITAVAGASQSFTSLLSNSGTASSGSSFTNLFQFDHDSDHITSVNASQTVVAGPIANGGSTNASSSYTFPLAGNGYVRTCVDNNVSFVGTINEGQAGANEGNNCSNWVTVTVSAALAVPTLNAPTAVSITTTGATLGASVTSLGNPATLTARGVCYGALANPGLAGLNGGTCMAATLSQTLGAHTVVVPGLTAGTLYHYTGYATNTTGTGYTLDATFTTTSLPNLTAGLVSPSSATAGVSTIFTSSISNNGGASTGASFSNFFQIAAAANGGGAITDVAPVSMSPLAGSTSSNATTTYTPLSTTTFSIRACADKTSSAGGGVITESNEGDNCSASWTNVTVAVGSTGTLTSSPVSSNPTCVISRNSSTCSIPFSWNITSSNGATAVTCNTNDSGLYSFNFQVPGASPNVNPGNNVNFAVPYLNDPTNTGTPTHQGRTFYLYNNGVLIDTKTATASCNSPSDVWDGTKCAAGAPIVNSFAPDKSSISPGDSAVISWNVSNADTCDGVGFSTGGAVSGNATVSPGATTSYHLDCYGGGYHVGVDTQITVGSTGGRKPSEHED